MTKDQINEGADIRKDSVRQARDTPCDALSTDLVTRPTASTPEDAAFYSWWFASHKEQPTERERLMWVCGYVRGRVVGQGLAGEVYENG